MDDESHSGEGIPKEKENGGSTESNPEPQSPETPISVGLSKPNFSPPESHNCRKTYKHIKEEIKFWFEIAGIIAGIGVLILLWKQYGEMVKATKATLDAVKISQDQTIISKRQLDDSEAQQRAWLRIEKIEVRRMTNYARVVKTPFENVTNYGVEVF